MNKNFLIEQIKKTEVFDRAYLYAIVYRIKEDSYCNFIEIDYYRQNKMDLLQEIQSDFEDLSRYETETAFSFYLPKTDMFFRRMIHISFKDLVIKFIFVVVLAEFLDFTFIKNCFSYRLKKDINKKQNELLYQYYYEGFEEFKTWQLDQIEDNTCMLKTDISSFYDSISHQYLLSSIARQANILEDNPFIIIFGKSLKFKVCYYSVDGKINETYNSQGIPIGDEADGFIANMFLKEADEALFNFGVNFGRFVDDIRIFTNTRSEAIKHLMLLQENLLKIGLNLNAAKTKILEAKEEIIEVVEKKPSRISDLLLEEELEFPNFSSKKINKKELIEEVILQEESLQYNDNVYFQYAEVFSRLEEIDSEDKAKIFCSILNKIPLGARIKSDFLIEKLEWLCQLSVKYPKYWKYYSWLFVKFVCLDYENEIQLISLKYLFKVFDGEEFNMLIKTRILHHLVKPRKGSLTYIERISTRKKLKERIVKSLEELVKANCIALQLNCIYAYYLLLKDHQRVQEFVSKNLKRPIPEPVQYAVYQIGTLCFKGSLRLPSFEEILEESKIEDQSESFLYQ